MSNSLTADLTSEDAEIKAAIEKLFIEIEREYEKMKKDQEEFKCLKARTRAILVQLEAT